MDSLLNTLVLAFDLGTKEAGWVLVDSNDEILHLGYWKALKGSLDMRLRGLMGALYPEMADLSLGDHAAGRFLGRQILVAYEAPHAKYAKPVLALGQAVGILKAILFQMWPGGDPQYAEMPMEISIAEAKLALTGRGNAEKRMVLDMARQLSGCQGLNQHQADSYAVAVCAWGRLRQEAIVKLAEDAER